LSTKKYHCRPNPLQIYTFFLTFANFPANYLHYSIFFVTLQSKRNQERVLLDIAKLKKDEPAAYKKVVSFIHLTA